MISSFALLVFAIPLLIVMAILRFTGEGDVWYFQDRVGAMGKKFRVYKFATMRRDSEKIGTQDITLRNDPRVLPFGKILRKTKINELPQLINIFLGDMSFVGWRPLLPKSFSYYPQHVQERIIYMKPGLTGVGSIIFRDEEAITARATKPPQDVYKEDIAPYKGALELWYQQNQCFWLDLKIIALTMAVLVFTRYPWHEKYLKGIPPRPASLQA